MMNTFDLLVQLRGGLPDKCDFCGQEYSAKRYPIPEEAGEWACSECVARWDAARGDK
jgi:ribosomal protein L37AE/L43A